MTEPLKNLEAVVLYVVLEVRDLWGTTTQRSYAGASALQVRLEAAKVEAERQRSPGASFEIEEVPGLLLASADRSIAMVDFHSANSFGEWDIAEARNLLRRGVDIERVLDSFAATGIWTERPNPDSLIRVELGGPDAPKRVTGAISFWKWKSMPFGSHRPMTWREDRAKYQADGVRAVRAAFARINNLVPAPPSR